MNGYSIDYRGHIVPRIGDFKSSHITSMPRPQDSTERLLSKIRNSRLCNLSCDHGTAKRIRIEYTADIQSIHGYTVVYPCVQNRVHGSKCVYGVIKW